MAGSLDEPNWYTFRKTENDWKILAAMVHDPDTVLRLC